MLIGLLMSFFRMSAQPCDSVLLKKLDNFYRLYQDDSLRFHSEQALRGTQKESLCHYYYSFYLINSYVYHDVSKAEDILGSLDQSDEVTHELLRLVSLQAILNRKNEHRERLRILQKAEGLAATLDEDKFKSRWHFFCFKSLAKTYSRLAVYDSAVYYALRFLESESKALKLDGYLTLSSIYVDMDDHRASIKELKKADALVDKVVLETYPRLACNLYNNLGAGYIDATAYDSALLYLRKSLDIAQQLNDSKLTYARLTNLGLVYLELENSEEARSYFLQGLEIITSSEAESQSYKLQVLNENLAQLELNVGNHDQALEYALASLKYAENSGRKDLVIDANQVLSQVYEKVGDLPRAFSSYKTHSELKAEILDEEKIQAIEELKTRYETEKKEQQINTLAQQNRIKDLLINQQRIILGSSISLFILLSGISLFAYRQRRLLTDQKQLALEQSLLRAQMNPHFIFNALNSIQNFVTSNHTAEATLYLAKFGELTRDILEASRENWIPLERELRIIDNYLDLERARFQKDLRLMKDIQVEEAEHLLVPPMLIQPFLENAIKHGFAHKTDGSIFLSIREEADRVKVEISDDGDGLQESNSPHRSRAIEITNQRLRNLRGKQSSGVEISNRTAGGVLVQFNFPRNYAL